MRHGRLQPKCSRNPPADGHAERRSVGLRHRRRPARAPGRAERAAGRRGARNDRSVTSCTSIGLVVVPGDPDRVVRARTGRSGSSSSATANGFPRRSSISAIASFASTRNTTNVARSGSYSIRFSPATGGSSSFSLDAARLRRGGSSGSHDPYSSEFTVGLDADAVESRYRERVIPAIRRNPSPTTAAGRSYSDPTAFSTSQPETVGARDADPGHSRTGQRRGPGEAQRQDPPDRCRLSTATHPTPSR